jgi:hypothetical protein
MAIHSCKAAFLLLCLMLFSGMICGASAPPDKSVYNPSKAAAERCNVKLKNLEDFASKRKLGRKQTMRFTQDEINSYLAMDLSAQYHPCLKSLMIILEENKLQAMATIDFDRLRSASSKVLPKILGYIFSGMHTLAVNGQLFSNEGKAYFRLDQALFDDNALPRYLVEEIITAVGRRQNPPFDPLQPSKIFYEIEKADIHAGYVIVYQ